MFVVKIPKRSDFCGCPPCPLCFDWIDEIPVAVEENKSLSDDLQLGYRVDGMRKMAEDLLGKDVVPTPEQKQQLSEGAMLIHERNKVQQKIDPVEAHQTVIDESFTAREVNGFLKSKRAQTLNVRKPLNRITCDSIADEKAAAEKEKVPEEVQETIKNNVPVPSLDAPVDYDLIRRERSSKRSSVDGREDMMKRYREKMEQERRRWQEVIYRAEGNFRP